MSKEGKLKRIEEYRERNSEISKLISKLENEMRHNEIAIINLYKKSGVPKHEWPWYSRYSWV